MKRLIALLCTLCMIATMAPVAVMAEDVVVINSWDGSVAPTLADNGFEMNSKTMVDVEFLYEGLGGNTGSYMKFATVPDEVSKDEALVHSNGKLAYEAPFVAVSLNVYGKALQDMYTRYSSNVKPQISGNISGSLTADRWNNVFVVYDGAAKETTLYVNGKEIRTCNFYSYVEDLGKTEGVTVTVDRENAKWTWAKGDKTEEGSFSSVLSDIRFRFVRNTKEALVWHIDDLKVITSDTKPVPSAGAVITSAGAKVVGEEIVLKNPAGATLAAEGATILVNTADGWVEQSEVVPEDEVVVVSADNVYKYYTVKEDKCDKFWGADSAESLTANLGWVIDGITQEYTNEALGGKINDTYAKYTGTKNEAVIYGKNAYSTRYFAMSINAYGKSIRDFFPRLGSGSNKPSLVAPNNSFGGNLSGLLTDGIWNNVFFVFDSQTKDMKTYVNGVLAREANLYDTIEGKFNGTADREAGTATANGVQINADYMNLKGDLRIVFKNGEANYIDDLAFVYSDEEPTPYEAVDTIIVNGKEVSGSLVLAEGETAEISAEGATVMVNDGSAWSETNTVKVGDQIVLVTPTACGNLYAAPITVVDASRKETLADMTSGFSFVQGGRPYIQDAVGNYYNVPVTGAGNDVLISKEDNIFGTDISLNKYVVGYNFAGSTQTYYQANWNKTAVESNGNYLVFEADFAFDADEYVNGFSMSTNGGTKIGTIMDYKPEIANRVNHYMWIYDIAEGKYVDYLNGVALVEEPTEIDAAFAAGTKTNIRFTANGTTNMTAQKTDKLDANGERIPVLNEDGTQKVNDKGEPVWEQIDWIGTYEETMKGYMDNLILYSAALAPSVKAGPSLEGAVGGCYPVYDIEGITVDSLKAKVADADNIYVYANRDYAEVVADGSAAADFGYVVVAEKNGIFAYYRVCKMPAEDSTFAIDTMTANGADRYIAIANIAENRSMALVIVEKDADGNLVNCKIASRDSVAPGDIIFRGIGEVAEGNSVQVYVWDSIASLKTTDKPLTFGN